MPHRIRAGPGRSAQGECSRFPGGRRRSFCKTWRPDRARNEDNGMLPVKKLPSRLQSPPWASSQRAHASAGLVPFTEVNPPQRQLESTIALE